MSSSDMLHNSDQRLLLAHTHRASSFVAFSDLAACLRARDSRTDLAAVVRSNWEMAPHLSEAELDWALSQSASGKTPIEIHAALVKKRGRKNAATPHISMFRKALKRKSYRRGRTETRGRTPTYSAKWVRNMNKTRKDLIKKADGGSVRSVGRTLSKSRGRRRQTLPPSPVLSRDTVWTSPRAGPERNPSGLLRLPGSAWLGAYLGVGCRGFTSPRKLI